MRSVKLIALLVTGASLMSFSPVENAVVNTSTTISNPTLVKWKTESVNLGEITQGKPVTIEFEFTNTSDAAVIVTNAQASCGCTVADYPKEPILPGKSAKITATYNAAAKGVFTKNVTVYIQNEDPKVLSFNGTVI